MEQRTGNTMGRLAGTRFVIAIVLTVLLSSFSTAARADAAYAKETRHLLVELRQAVILPGYQHLAQASDHLVAATTTFCDQRTPPRLQNLQDAWRATMAAWMEMQAVRVGPAKQDNIDLRLQFWPDKRGNVKRSVEAQLANTAFDITEKNLSAASAAGQGLPALEYLLFDPEGKSVLPAYTEAVSGDRRCRYVEAAAEGVRVITGSLYRRWRDAGDAEIRAFHGRAARSMTAEEITMTLQALVKGMVELSEIVLGEKLGKPLGKDGAGVVKPYLAESWRSRGSVPNIRHNLIGLQKLYKGNDGYGLDDYLAQLYGQQSLNGEINARFRSAIAAAAAVKVPLFDALQTGEGGFELQRLYLEVEILARLLRDGVAQTLGVSFGFNSADGD